MKYAAYSEYKSSGVEWLDVVPSHWTVKAARFGYSIQLGKMLQPESSSSLDAETPYLKSQHVQWESVRVDDLPLMWASPSELVKYGIRDGDLLVCEGGDVGRAGIVKEIPKGTIIQNALHRVRPRVRHDIRFLMYVLEHASGQSWFDIICNRSTIAHFTGEKFGALRVPEPPLDEQQTIARFLDAKTAQIDALVAQKRQLIEKLKEKRQALIARTVTRGLPPEAAKAAGREPNPEMKDSGVDWLGEIPAHWGEDKVARLFRAMKGRNAAQLTKEYCATIEGEYPVYSGQTENDGVMSSIDEFEFDAGEDGYLFSTTVGAKAMSLMHLKGKFSLSQNCMVIAPMSDKVQVRFYYYHLQPLFQFERGLIPEHMQASFRMEDLYQYRVAIPPKDEQRAIADYLDQMCATADDLLDVTGRAIVKLNEYRQALITSAVTGKIDVRELA